MTQNSNSQPPKPDDESAARQEDLHSLALLGHLVPKNPEETALLARLSIMVEGGFFQRELGADAQPQIWEAHEWRWLDGPTGDGARAFQFTSPLPLTSEPGGLAKGVLWPSDAGTKALLVLHPAFVADLDAMKVLSRFVRKQQVDVFALWAPGHGPRTLPHMPSGGNLVARGGAGMILAVMQAEAEAVAAVRRLWAMGYKDVHLLGASLGGLVAALAASRVAPTGLTLLVPATDLEHQLWPAVAGTEPSQGKEALLSPGFAAIRPLERSPAPGLSPDRIQFMAALFDEVCPYNSVAELAQKWGSAKPLALPCGHLGFFRRWAEVRRVISPWIARAPLNPAGSDLSLRNLGGHHEHER